MTDRGASLTCVHCLVILLMIQIFVGTATGNTTEGLDCAQGTIECDFGFCNDNNGQCVCFEGYTGIDCGIGVCEREMPCKNGGSCYARDDGTHFCECGYPWEGQNCTKINLCAAMNCTNERQPCRVVEDDFGDMEAKCYCIPGYTGIRCEEDVDECAEFGCFNNGSCNNTFGDFSCTCPVNVTGQVCERRRFPNGTTVRTSGCDSDPCQNNGVCQEQRNAAHIVCNCVPGWGGDFCETATCTSDYDSYYYGGETGFDDGYYNQDYGNPDDYCLFKGECTLRGASQLPSCDCQNGYYGERCQNFKTQIESVWPLYGPLAGGTIIYINGTHLNYTEVVSIMIGTETCDYLESLSSNKVLVCETQPVNYSLVAIPQDIKIYWDEHNITIILDQTFLFKPNPAVDKVEPLDSIISGGVILTIYGVSLNSVAAPELEVSMVYRGNLLQVFSTVCRDVFYDRMYCPTPDITLLDEEGNINVPGINNPGINPGFSTSQGGNNPGNNSPTQSRRKRSLMETQREPANLVHRKINHMMTKLLSGMDNILALRKKRQAGNEPTKVGSLMVNNEELEFFLGLKLDGIQGYRNLSEVLPEYGMLNVFLNPKFYPWEKDITLSDPEDRRIEAKGEHLDVGISVTDYKVAIGLSECEDIQLFTDRLICQAPLEVPQLSPDHDRGDKYSVRVLIGTWELTFEVGKMDYDIRKSFWDDPAAKWGIIGGAIALGVIIIIAISICISRKCS